MELDSLKIGCVRYLNALPLLHGYKGNVIYEHPAALAQLLEQGDCDVALVPTMELFLRPGWKVVDGVSIASDGPVYSVFMAYKGEMSSVRRIGLDGASLTSRHLLQCLMAEFLGMRPTYSSGSEDSFLLIGNQAIDFRRRKGAEFNYFDLGEAWKGSTGLPFVFALWLIRPGVGNGKQIAEELRALKRSGVKAVPQIAESSAYSDHDFLRRYLSEHIRFDLGESEKTGMQKFRDLLYKHSLLKNGPFDWEYV